MVATVKASRSGFGRDNAARVLEALKRGYEPGPLFDPASKLSYALVAVAGVVGLVMFRIEGFSIDPKLGFGPPIWVGLALVAGWLARRTNHLNIATGLETTAFIYGQGIAFMLIIYSLMAMPFPMVDPQLAAADRMLGFHWPDLAAPFRSNPDLTEWGKVIYKSFNWQPALVTVSLAVAGQHRRAWHFITAAVISLWITAVVGSIFPADTPVVYFHVARWPELVSAWQASAIIHALKNGTRFLDAKMMGGLITAPSYHAVAAALFTWALYPLKWLRWPVVLLNVLLLACAVVIGGHYVVDIFAGLALAAASIWIAGRFNRQINA